MSEILPVSEYFHSWQGEGFHTGKSAFFIRTYGCPVKCSWCDSPETWHPDHIPDKVDKKNISFLVKEAVSSKCEFCVITGGEPAIHDLTSLVDSLRKENIASHIETCGAYPIKGNVDWITLSPKWNALPTEDNLFKANEIKLIVEDEKSIQKWITQLGQKSLENKVVFLNPEWSMRNEPTVLNSISNFVQENGHPYRVGFQLHKQFNVR